MIGDSMKIFKNLFSLIWKIFDVLMFIAFAVTITVTMFMWNITAGGITLSVVFILAGLISEFIEMYYNITFDDPKIEPILQAPQSDLIHMKLLSIDGGKTGISPLYSLRRESKIQRASDRLTISALKNSMSASGVLKIKGGGLLDDKMKAARSKSFMKRSKSGGPIVLDDLEEFTALEIKSNVAQLLSQTDWTSKQYAKVYGLPDSYIGGQGDQQSSIQQISGMYASALNRYLRPAISELEYKLSDHISVNMRPAIDPLGDNYLSTISTATRWGAVAENQATYILQEAGYIPKDLPAPENTNKKTTGQSNEPVP